MRKDKILERVIRNVAVEHSVSEKTVEDVLEHMFSTTRKTLGQPEMPSVLLHNFGKFYIKPGRIDGIIRNIINKYREGKVSRERAVEVISKVWPLRQRLKIESK